MSRPLLDRVIERFDRRGPDECWPWTGAMNNVYGYGRMSIGHKRQVRAHRLVYEILVGPIPTGYQLDHLCRNRRCVNPAHLEPVSNRVNCMRGEAPHVVLARKNVCKRGHPLVDENIIWKKNPFAGNGQRQCRTCVNEWYRLRYRRLRGAS